MMAGIARGASRKAYRSQQQFGSGNPNLPRPCGTGSSSYDRMGDTCWRLLSRFKVIFGPSKTELACSPRVALCPLSRGHVLIVVGEHGFKSPRIVNAAVRHPRDPEEPFHLLWYLSGPIGLKWSGLNLVSSAQHLASRSVSLSYQSKPSCSRGGQARPWPRPRFPGRAPCARRTSSKSFDCWREASWCKALTVTLAAVK